MAIIWNNIRDAHHVSNNF